MYSSKIKNSERLHYHKSVAKKKSAGKQLPSLNNSNVSIVADTGSRKFVSSSSSTSSVSVNISYYRYKNNNNKNNNKTNYYYYNNNNNNNNSINNESSYVGGNSTNNEEEYKVNNYDDSAYNYSNNYNQGYESNGNYNYYENKVENVEAVNNYTDTKKKNNITSLTTGGSFAPLSTKPSIIHRQQRRQPPRRPYRSPPKHQIELNHLKSTTGYYYNNSNSHQQQRMVAVKPPKTVHHIRAAYSGVGTLRILCVKPLLIQIDNFIAPSRCKRVVKYANSRLNFTNESADVEHGDSRARTSTGCWVSEESQINHPDIKYINESLANLVGFPEENCEPLHVVKYTGGQEYWPHNDFIENHKYLSCGGRIATMLLYLTDCADGGATNFPLLDVTIYPKPGTVVLWYNVLPTSDGSHVIVDQRMLHSGMPVGPAGEKMIMCKWVHPYEWIGQ